MNQQRYICTSQPLMTIEENINTNKIAEKLCILDDSGAQLDFELMIKSPGMILKSSVSLTN